MARGQYGGERRPVRRVSGERANGLDRTTWPGTLPAARQLVDDGLDLGPLTVLVGENGAGKSTVVEAIAMAYGLSPEGGSTGARLTTRPSESVLHKSLSLVRNPGAARWGFFLRAETMHGFYSYLEANPGAGDPVFHEMSHGESFLSLLSERFDSPGLYVLDEPEAALSFSSSLALTGLLAEMAAGERTQAIVSTHSPIIAATPGADIYEVGDWGLRRVDWEDLELVRHWRRFMDQPAAYLRHLVD